MSADRVARACATALLGVGPAPRERMHYSSSEDRFMKRLFVLSTLTAAAFMSAVFTGGALLGQAPGNAGKGNAAAPTGNAQNGKKIFDADGCYQCHGHEAQGGVGPRLGPRPLSWAAFSRYVRAPTEEMPPYTAKVVSDQELADIYAFLSSIPA